VKRSEVKVPAKFSGIAAEAYVDGYLAGYRDKLLDATMMSMMAESAVELMQHGTGRLLKDKGVEAVVGRVAKKLGRHADLAERIATAAKAVRDIGRSRGHR
jgi:hypothetical protein